MSASQPPRNDTSLWRNGDYRLLWLGQGVSSLGTGISQLAFPLLILTLTNSPAAAGFAGAFERIPAFLLSLTAGALVDRWDRKRVMVICNAGLALCLASIGLALALGHLTLVQIYGVAFAIGIFSIFFQVAELATLAYVVPREQLTVAVAQNEAVYSTVSLLAPSLSGILFSAGRMVPFLADAVSYLVALSALLRMRTPFQSHRYATPTSLRESLLGGLRWLWGHAILRHLALLNSYFYVLMYGSTLIVILMARQHHVPNAIIGVIFAVGGAGNIAGTLLSASLRRWQWGHTIGALLIAYMLIWPFFGLAAQPFILAIVLGALALTDSLFSILQASYRLMVVPDELQGRVSSASNLILSGSLAVGQAVVGVILQQWGIGVTIITLWVGLILLVTLTLGHTRLRQTAAITDNE